MCVFCSEFRASGQGRIITCYSGDLLLLPTLGAFVEGYSLLLPRRHYLSFAEVAAGAPADMTRAVTEARNLVESTYGNAIVAEHGVGTCNMGAGCVSHAHLHIIPVPDRQDVLDAYEEVGGPAKRLGSFVDLASREGGAYVYLSIAPDDHRVWRTGLFERQFVRKVCARLHGIGCAWDWERYPYRNNMAATIVVLSEELAA